MTKSDGMAAGGKPFCPSCEKAATGNFCQNCGATLGGRFCNQCGSKLSASAKFCNQCGNKALGGSGSGHKAAVVATVGGQNLPWWIAGLALFGLIVVVGVQAIRPDAQPEQVQGVPATGVATGASAVDLSSMTPLQAAERLFNRVMTSISAGDSTEANAFLPMAIDAYVIAQPLDADGLFHLSLLQRTAFRLDEALATAGLILGLNPDHLLGLSAAAAAANESGDPDLAHTHYQHIVDVYDAQMADALPEYLDHSGITNALKATAEAFLAGR